MDDGAAPAQVQKFCDAGVGVEVAAVIPNRQDCFK